MQENNLLQMAALVAYKFRLDPLTVLDANTFEWNVRVAALQVVLDMETKAHEDAKRRVK